MPKVNVYLPDALAARVRAADLPVSRICQVALAAALSSIDDRVVAGEEELLPEPLGLGRQLNPYAVLFVRDGYASARRRGSDVVEGGDLLHGLLAQPDALVHRIVLRAAGVPASALREELETRLPRHEPTGREPRLSDEARAVLRIAEEEAERTSSSVVHGNHVGLGLLRAGGVASEVLRAHGVEELVNEAVLDLLDDGMAYSRVTSPAPPDGWTSSMLVDLAARLDRIERALDAPS